MENNIFRNTIELHYWLKDESHTMDAFVLNKCEWELLNLFKEVASIAKVNIVIESEAITEGGIRQWFNIRISSNTKTAIVASAVTSFFTFAFTQVPQFGLDILKEHLKSNPELEQLAIEEKKVEIESKKLDNEIKREKLKEIRSKNSKQFKDTLQNISSSTKIAKRTSNFYEELSKEVKVNSITINNYFNCKPIQQAIEIKREDFQKYILTSNLLETITDEEAIVEIVSPVLKKGNYQWKGIYNGEILNFNMKSNEFKTLVQSGKIEFKNGTCIKCVLEMPRYMNNLGEEVISSYNIIKVIGTYDDNTYNETNEGRIYRKKKEADIAQLELFPNITQNEK